jgi:predicted transposase YbfD/YdcC
VESENHYLIHVKKNQRTLYEDAQLHASTRLPSSVDRQEEREKGGISTRTTLVFDASESEKTATWSNLKSYVQVDRTWREKGQMQQSRSFYISDLALDAAQFQQHIRGHWGIENLLHRVKDVLYKEDKNRIRCGSGPICASILSATAINIHRKKGHSSITNGQILFRANVKELIKIYRT